MSKVTRIHHAQHQSMILIFFYKFQAKTSWMVNWWSQSSCDFNSSKIFCVKVNMHMWYNVETCLEILLPKTKYLNKSSWPMNMIDHGCYNLPLTYFKNCLVSWINSRWIKGWSFKIPTIMEENICALTGKVLLEWVYF